MFNDTIETLKALIKSLESKEVKSSEFKSYTHKDNGQTIIDFHIVAEEKKFKINYGEINEGIRFNKDKIDGHNYFIKNLQTGTLFNGKEAMENDITSEDLDNYVEQNLIKKTKEIREEED